jgi:hypothetical protein
MSIYRNLSGYNNKNLIALAEEVNQVIEVDSQLLRAVVER